MAAKKQKVVFYS